MTFRLRPKAIADLDNIIGYAREKWGEKQADQFVGLLRETFRVLALYPEMGRSALARRYRAYAVRGHIIYYRADEEGIVVARELHGARRQPRRIT